MVYGFLTQFKTNIESTTDFCQFLTITGIDNIVADLSMDSQDVSKLSTGIEDLFHSLDYPRKKSMNITIGDIANTLIPLTKTKQ